MSVFVGRGGNLCFHFTDTFLHYITFSVFTQRGKCSLINERIKVVEYKKSTRATFTVLYLFQSGFRAKTTVRVHWVINQDDCRERSVSKLMLSANLHTLSQWFYTVF